MPEHDKKTYANMLIDAYKLAAACDGVVKQKEKQTLESLAALFLRRRVRESNDLLERIQLENQIIDDVEKSMSDATRLLDESS